MVSTDFTLLGMLLSLAVTAGHPRFRCREEIQARRRKASGPLCHGDRGSGAGLIFGAIHVWLAMSWAP